MNLRRSEGEREAPDILSALAPSLWFAVFSSSIVLAVFAFKAGDTRALGASLVAAISALGSTIYASAHLRRLWLEWALDE